MSRIKASGLKYRISTGPNRESTIPDFIVLVEDDNGDDDLLHLIVEIKGYRKEDAKEKKSTAETYWVPGVNRLRSYGRWAFAEFTKVESLQQDFEDAVEDAFQRMLSAVRLDSQVQAAEWLARVGGSAPGIEPIPRRQSITAK